MFPLGQKASAVSAMLARQIAVLELTMNVLPGGAKQIGTVFRTGLTVAALPLPSGEQPPTLPLDRVVDQRFRWPPYLHQVGSTEAVDLALKISKDTRLYNRLTPQARDFLLAHINARMASYNSDEGARSLILGSLSFYPDHIGLYVTLSGFYTAKRMHAVQAHLCETAIKLASAKGQQCSEALSNLGVAHMVLVRGKTFVIYFLTQ